MREGLRKVPTSRLARLTISRLAKLPILLGLANRPHNDTETTSVAFSRAATCD